MLVRPEINRRNQRQALGPLGLVASRRDCWGWLSPPLWLLLGLSPFTYWWLRRRCLRRMAVMQQPFPDRLGADPPHARDILRGA